MWQSGFHRIINKTEFILLLIVGFLMAVTGLGVRLRGPRLIAYGMVLILGLSYARGLAIFYLLTPIIFARPVAECAPWLLAAQGKHVQSSQGYGFTEAASSLDPVLLYPTEAIDNDPCDFVWLGLFS